MSRLIVKGLPNKITEQKLRDTFKIFGTITDVSLKYTSDNVFRKFAFVGFENEESSKNAAAKLNNTYIQTSKIQVEECLPFNATNKPRPWSKYAKGSSAYKRLHNEETNVENQTEKKKAKTATNLDEDKSKNLKSEEIFENFLQKQGIAIDKEPEFSDANTVSVENFLNKFTGNKKLSLLYRGLPATLKQKNFKEWISPIKLQLTQILRLKDETIIIATFNRLQDLRKALLQNNQFLGGYKVKITQPFTVTKTNVSNENDLNIDVVQENAKIKEEILETGRLFIRNLPYICTEEHLMELFRKHGEIAELQCIIDKKTGNCKGFAIVTFIFPEHAYKAYEELDGAIFKGRMLHIIPGQSKKEGDENNIQVRGLSKLQIEKTKKLKTNAGKAHNWNPLFVGANATAETLAQRLEVQKRELLNGEGDNSAAVRLAMAETQLVNETRDFMQQNNISTDKSGGKRSQTTIIVKNMPAGNGFKQELQKTFERFGEIKNISFPSGNDLSAIVEMQNKIDAKRAFNLIAYSHLKGSDQPLYLEWAKSEKKKEKIDEEDKGNKVDENLNDEKNTKILVRNIPFQATVDEITQLFSAFGELRDVRLPKKVGIRSVSSHRGFGFVDFISHSDAKRAMESLKHSTHLYGRRLVLEWAKKDETN